MELAFRSADHAASWYVAHRLRLESIQAQDPGVVATLPKRTRCGRCRGKTWHATKTGNYVCGGCGRPWPLKRVAVKVRQQRIDPESKHVLLIDVDNGLTKAMGQWERRALLEYVSIPDLELRASRNRLRLVMERLQRRYPYREGGWHVSRVREDLRRARERLERYLDSHDLLADRA